MNQNREVSEDSGSAGDEPHAASASRDAAAVASLRASLRRARIESAEQFDGICDLRNAAGARLDILRERVAPIIDEARRHADMFDLALSQGERPRLFIDMLAFVEMARDQRAYRFVQDSKHGRMLIAEGEDVDAITRAIADYVARRLVEREKALAADALFWPGRSAQKAAAAPAAKPESGEEAAARVISAVGTGGEPRRRPAALRIFARVWVVLIEILGAVALFALLAAAGLRLLERYGAALSP